jgi:dTDP-4-amino-4,6-dideoxygalactose transaminase
MSDDRIRLTDPDISRRELDAVLGVLQSPRLSAGPMVERFEAEFAAALGRTYGIAVSSGTAALLVALRALRIGPGDEVITSPIAWHHVAHAITLVGATPVLADIDYWSCTLAPEKAASKITPSTRAILAGNTNGHPAAWKALRELADAHGLHLLEDSTEAIGSVYLGRPVGSFGDVAIFDFSQPSALCCGEGAMLVTDDPDLATELSYHRSHGVDDRRSVSVGSRVPLQALPSELSAALGVIQLERLDEILSRRKRVEAWYLDQIQAFEGIKPPYLGPDVDEVHWFVYLVHLGTRFTRSSRNQILDDLATEDIEAAAFCNPLHLHYHYMQLGYAKRDFLVAEKIADRALALPFHGHLTQDNIRFIVRTAKDSSINVGAGTAIY